ncbi:polysaccharide biosynthesis protein [Macrococcus armenti]|uniref:polysaccharide biosynthesis protein n=1 Tax=Macrococcus armenti TaxID=2875764 RepID=UPI001CCBB24F|nr:nucleoside-diphosphate sugar epimerase/dehydratase [Macrococcus armenti]UBH16502.1 polysaccharide biosynthesis protein [Macrococcus armenti]UBH18858.1 polysaccharide biosynthesis protein [Macrococcus armenti]UBH21135.1 polysaccharide biosynthesis protein [Macrococcus armenti]
MTAKKRLMFLIILDSIIVSLSVFFCYSIIFPFFKGDQLNDLLVYSVLLLLSHHLFAYIFNLYHRAWEYASINELLAIVKGVTASILLTLVLSFIINGQVFIRLIFITWMMHLILIGGSRISWRVLRRYILDKDIELISTLVVGAGRGGNLLIHQMLSTPTMGMKPVVAVDDDVNKKNIELTDGIKVRGRTSDIHSLVNKYDIKRIVIAIPSLDKQKLNDIYKAATETGSEVLIMPNIDDVLAGKLEVSQLKKVEVEDLLGRAPIELDDKGISEQIDGKTILVTGAGGSIGSELCRQLVKYNPKRLIILGHGENSIYLINEELNNKLLGKVEIIPVIADVQDRARMFEQMEKYSPEIVYHAAAHKHVPLMEYNPTEAVKNNIIGTKNTAEAALNANVKRFVLVSTDKAVNPPNIMGATKRVAEMVIQTLDKESTTTRFVAVRFGNVLGSRGSVIPKFKQQIEMGGPITVTHPDMTRYFMTIPEASRLVIQAGTLSKGGEIFVLDMGEPVKIVDLAKNMIELSGFSEKDIKIEFTGARPGEKLFEELLNANEIQPEQVYPKIYVGKAVINSKENIYNLLNNIENNNYTKDLIINFANGKEI